MPLSNGAKVSQRGLSNRPELIGRSPAFKYLWRVHHQHCLRTGRRSTLTPDEFNSLLLGNCHYCGSPPFNRTKLLHSANIAYNGIDRVDQSGQYQIGNVVSCCKHCNSMKSSRPVSDFLAQVKKIFRHSLEGKG